MPKAFQDMIRVNVAPLSWLPACMSQAENGSSMPPFTASVLTIQCSNRLARHVFSWLSGAGIQDSGSIGTSGEVHEHCPEEQAQPHLVFVCGQLPLFKNLKKQQHEPERHILSPSAFCSAFSGSLSKF